MAVISFVSSKGGVGKSTTVIGCASVLAEQGKEKGIRIGIVDTDDNRHSYAWTESENCPKNIVGYPSNEESVIETIEKAEESCDFVFVDVEGSANLAISHAVSCSDLVVIPFQASGFDVKESVKVIKLIKNQMKILKRIIHYSVLLTVTSPFSTKLEKEFLSDIKESGIDTFKCTVMDRQAFKVMCAYGESIYNLTNNSVSGLPRAIKNIESVTEELKLKLKKAMEN